MVDDVHTNPSTELRPKSPIPALSLVVVELYNVPWGASGSILFSRRYCKSKGSLNNSTYITVGRLSRPELLWGLQATPLLSQIVS